MGPVGLLPANETGQGEQNVTFVTYVALKCNAFLARRLLLLIDFKEVGSHIGNIQMARNYTQPSANSKQES